MFSGFVSIIKGMLNKGMNKLETPEVLAEQAQMELETNVKKIKEAVISGITTEKSLQKQMKEHTGKVEEWKKRAELAVQKGNDDIAKQCLEKRQESMQALQGLATQLEEQGKANQALKKRLSDAENELRNFHTKKKELLARGQANDALASANEHLTGSGTGTASTSMDRWEQKIAEKEMRNEAIGELRDEPLLDEFKLLEDSGGMSEIEMELAAMKEQLSTPAITMNKDSDGTANNDVAEATVVEEVDQKKDG